MFCSTVALYLLLLNKKSKMTKTTECSAFPHSCLIPTLNYKCGKNRILLTLKNVNAQNQRTKTLQWTSPCDK